jgi:MtN3 and saliva related transmembrane protein
LSAEWFGYIAGGITTFAILPQVIRVFKLKSAREISLTFTISMLVGFSCWLTYGICLHLTPLIIWNSISLVLFIIFLCAKLKYGR